MEGYNIRDVETRYVNVSVFKGSGTVPKYFRKNPLKLKTKKDSLSDYELLIIAADLERRTKKGERIYLEKEARRLHVDVNRLRYAVMQIRRHGEEILKIKTKL